MTLSRIGNYCGPNMSLVLHYHPLSSYCWKVLIALYENGAPFEPRLVNPGDPESRAAFQTLWPTAKIPLLQDGDEVIPETSIMIEYVDRHYPGSTALLPKDPQARLEVRLWDRLFDNYVMTPMEKFIAQLLRPEAERDSLASTQSVAGLENAYVWIDSKIAGRQWAAGDQFSMADCAAAPSLFYANTIHKISGEQASLTAYFERLMQRPSVRRTVAEAWPYFQYYPMKHALPEQLLPEQPDGH